MRNQKVEDFDLEYIVETLNEVRHPFEIALLYPGNKFNISGIVRTAHQFLCQKIWFIDTQWYYRKGHMGTQKYERYNWVHVTEEKFVEHITNEKRNLVPFERHFGIKSQDIRHFEYPKNPILLFGNEKFGIPDHFIEMADTTVSIPMFGLTHDLNISVACGIAMFDFISKHYKRQENK